MFTIETDDGRMYIGYRGERPKTAREALDLSIAKWQFIVDNYVDEKIHDGACFTCGLCMLFFSNKCAACPVALYTGNPFCETTPYDEWEFSHSRLSAERELAFLKKISDVGKEVEC